MVASDHKYKRDNSDHRYKRDNSDHRYKRDNRQTIKIGWVHKDKP